MKLLLRGGADSFLTYEDGTSIMYVFAEQGGFLEALVHHPSFNTEFRDDSGNTLLLAASNAQFSRSRSDSTNVISLLCGHGA
jgi:hypothetical protein